MLIASIVLGSCHGASFAATHAAPLHFGAWLLFGVLVLSARRDTRSLSGTCIFFYLGSFAAGLYWMFESLADATSLGTPLALLTFAILCLVLALLPAAALHLAARFCALHDAVPAALAVAAAGSLADYARAMLLTGFPWLQSGHAYVESPFAILLPWLGVHAVGFIAVSTALLGSALIVKHVGRRERRHVSHAIPLVAIAAVLAALNLARATDSNGGMPLRVVLLQPALPLQEKFNRELLRRHVVRLLELADDTPADLVVAPETAIPTAWRSLPASLRSDITAEAARSGATWLLGAFDRAADGEMRNAAIAVAGRQSSAAPDVRAVYYKRHLVPFAEYPPYGLRWFTDLLQLPMAERQIAPDAPYEPMTIGGVGVASTICFDLLYPLQLGAAAPRIGMIVNHSNFQWSQNDAARMQFLAAARTQALSLNKPILIAANDGPTAVIDANGEVVKVLPLRRPGALTATVPSATGATLYQQLGDLPFLLAATIVLAVVLFIGRPRDNKAMPAPSGPHRHV